MKGIKPLMRFKWQIADWKEHLSGCISLSLFKVKQS
jgi:hypothetical protein